MRPRPHNPLSYHCLDGVTVITLLHIMSLQ